MCDPCYYAFVPSIDEFSFQTFSHVKLTARIFSVDIPVIYENDIQTHSVERSSVLATTFTTCNVSKTRELVVTKRLLQGPFQDTPEIPQGNAFTTATAIAFVGGGISVYEASRAVLGNFQYTFEGCNDTVAKVVAAAMEVSKDSLTVVDESAPTFQGGYFC